MCFKIGQEPYSRKNQIYYIFASMIPLKKTSTFPFIKFFHMLRYANITSPFLRRYKVKGTAIVFIKSCTMVKYVAFKNVKNKTFAT